MADRRVNAPSGSTGGKFRSRPRVIVIHDLEAPARKGMAYSLATGWLQTQKVSIHAIADPGEVIDMVPLDTVAYHCGGGNQTTLGIEHTGYAAWTFDQWVSGDTRQGQAAGAFEALRLGARKVAEWCRALDITPRWLTPAEVNAGLDGLATHDTMRQAKGGTTHTDPGKNFPYAIYLKMVQQNLGGGLAPDPTTPKPEAPPIGGAEPEDDLMYLFFNYPSDDQKTNRVFLSNGTEFRHVENMDELAFHIWRFSLLGVKPKYVIDGGTQLSEVPSGDFKAAASKVALATPVKNPGIFGVDAAGK
jgi:hypothetical protein